MADYNTPEFAWFCGLFEGEGSVIHRSNGNGAINRGLTISMTDEDVVLRVREATGVGTVRGPYETNGFKPKWVWTVSHWAAVEPLAQAMLPYMGQRRRSRLEALLANPPIRVMRNRAGQITECVNGHAFTPETTYINRNGHRNCRPCRNEAQARYRARKVTV